MLKETSEDLQGIKNMTDAETKAKVDALAEKDYNGTLAVLFITYYLYTQSVIYRMIAQILKEIPHEIHQVPAKEVLLQAGEIASKIFIVKSGCVRSWYNADGKDVTLQFFMPGQPVASFESLHKQAPSEYTVETVLPSEILVVNGLDFKAYIEEHPEQHLAGANFAMERLASYQKLFLSRIKDTPQQRYEALIREHPEIVSQIPQHHIASYLGITPVSLSRIRSRCSKI